MTDSLDDLRDNARRYVRRYIGDLTDYDDSLARDDISRMNASEAAAVLTMSETDMIQRWAAETDYESAGDYS